MLAMFVDFDFRDDSRELAARIASNALPMFDGMAGLRSKAFTVDESGRHATNVYLWDDEVVGRSFFTDELTEQVAQMYGATPVIRYAEVVGLVSNSQQVAAS